MTNVNRQFLLAARPVGAIRETDFDYHEAPVPEIRDGEILIRNDYVSLDPSMRGQMENRGDYAAPLEIGDVMRARGVGTIVASRHPGFAEGKQVFGYFCMQDYAVSNGDNIAVHVFEEPVDPTMALGVLGGTGMTAYFGLLDIGQPKPGQTVVVSGAAGATGSVAGQIAGLMGCRVIGLAGTDEKCAWLTGDLGFEASINYKTDNVADALDRHCPNGIDIYFDNVGGEILDLCLARLAHHARVVVCGGISRYNATGELAGPCNYFELVFRRARMEGFILVDYTHRFDEARAALRHWVDLGLVKQRATVVEGFEELPRALIKLFEGYNTGKMMVKVR